MSYTQPWPFYPDFQNVSASFSQSGELSVNTKFRRVDSYVIQPVFGNLNASMAGALAEGFVIRTSKNAGQITAQLFNNSTQVSSALSAYIWATGIQ